MMTVFIPGSKLEGFPCTSWGSEKFTASGAFKLSANTLLVTVEGVREDDVNPTETLEFLEKQKAISNAKEWCLSEMKDTDGSCEEHDFTTLLFEKK